MPVGHNLEKAIVLRGVKSGIHSRKQIHEHVQTGARLPLQFAQVDLRVVEVQHACDQRVELVLETVEKREAGALESNLQLNGCRTPALPLRRVQHGHAGRLATCTGISHRPGTIVHCFVSVIDAVFQLQPVWYEVLCTYGISRQPAVPSTIIKLSLKSYLLVRTVAN